jgi:hypothetical protein
MQPVGARSAATISSDQDRAQSRRGGGALQNGHCQIGSSGGKKKPVCGFVQVLVSTTRVWQMTNEIAVQLVNVDTPEIVKLLAL